MSRLRTDLLSSTATPSRPAQSPPQRSTAQVRFYYSQTFAYLIDRHEAEIERRLIDRPLALRKRRLAPLFVGVDKPDPEPVWDILRSYLDEIEAQMAKIAATHSPAYWFHLYRRIVPVLSSKHVGKRDDTTVTLVRQVAELAYLKHGDQSRTNDLGWITETKFATFLDGHYRTAMAQALRSPAAARRAYDEIKAINQSVMLEFSDGDLLAAFEVEGLAYEYWKTSAAMRSLGKGVRLEWHEEAQWFADHADGPDPLLFAVFDQRITEQTGLFTRLGTWTQFAKGEADFSTIYFTGYNPNGAIEDYPLWDPVAKQIAYGRARLNFHFGQAPLQAFTEGHAFMAQAFEKRHKVRLEAVLFCIKIASFFAFFPDRAVFAKDENERNAIILGNLTNLSFRGYKHIGLTIETIADEALWWGAHMGQEVPFDAAEIRTAFEFLLLSSEAAKFIGLWSGGKRPLLLPVYNGLLIDSAAIIPVLVNLFFGVRELTGAKGFAFEDSARDMLQSAGLDVVLSGEIEFGDGTKREIDAAIRIGDRLVLVECFSFERPVDYELAKPGIFQARVERVAAKIEQARSLAEAIEATPKGANFDFTWAKAIDWRLATPSVEFAWELSADLFDPGGMPRVLQLSELSRFLTGGSFPPWSEAIAAALKRAE